MSDLREAPPGLLPLGNRLRQGRRVAWLRHAPLRPNLVEHKGRLRVIECLPESAEILGVQPVRTRHLHDRLLPGFHRVPLSQRRREIFLQRQHAAVLGVEFDALQIHRRTTARHRVAPVELANRRQSFLRPIPLRRAQRPANAVRQQHGVISDVFRRVEILRHERWRHHKRVADVHEAFARGGIDRKLLRRIERLHAGQITNRVSVLRVVQPSQNDRSRIAGTSQRRLVQGAVHPRQQFLTLGHGHLRLFLRRHLAQGNLLDHALPHLRVLHDVRERLEAFEVEIALLFLGRVTAEAILLQRRLDGTGELLVELGEARSPCWHRDTEEHAQQGGNRQIQSKSIHINPVREPWSKI